MRAADCYQSRPLRTSLSAVTDIPQKAFPYTCAALGLASGFAEIKGEGRRTSCFVTPSTCPKQVA